MSTPNASSISSSFSGSLSSPSGPYNSVSSAYFFSSASLEQFLSTPNTSQRSVSSSSSCPIPIPNGIPPPKNIHSTNIIFPQRLLYQMGTEAVVSLPHTAVLEKLKADPQFGRPFVGLNTEDIENLAHFLKTKDMRTLQLREFFAEVSQYHYEETKNKKETVIKVALWRREADSQQTIPGLILYPSGFYVGDMRDRKAEGTGKLSFLNEKTLETELIVEGSWHNDTPTEVTFTLPSSQNVPFSISTTSIPNKYAVRFSNGDVYEGSLTFTAKSLTAMLSGSGEIRFTNGDIYKGGLKDGLMHSFGRSSIFKSKDGKVFEGCYEKGMRQGSGILKLSICGDPCSMQAIWLNNKPQSGKIKREGDDFQRTFKMDPSNRITLT